MALNKYLGLAALIMNSRPTVRNYIFFFLLWQDVPRLKLAGVGGKCYFTLAAGNCSDYSVV